MKWLDRLTWRFLRGAWERHDEFMEEEKNKARTTLRQARASRAGTVIANTSWPTDDSVKEHEQLRANSMNFKLYRCVGGHILETSVYDQRKEEHEHTLYMIKEEDEFDKQIAHAIMLEMMKQ